MRFLHRILYDDGTDPASTQRYRLQFFLVCGLPVLTFYVIHDLLRGSVLSVSMLAVSLALMLASLRDIRKNSERASTIFIASVSTILGTTHLWDGQANSMGLWLVCIIPIIAAFLKGLRAAVVCTGLSLVLVAGAMTIARTIELPQVTGKTDLEYFLMRGASLLIFGVFGLISSNVLRNQRRLLEAQQDESDRVRSQHEAAVVAKSAFFANISHEIRTPMNGLLGMTEYLLGCELSEDTRESVISMHEAGQSLVALLSEILDLSKMEARDDRIRQSRQQELQLRSEIQDALRRVEKKEAGRNLKLSLREEGCDGSTRVDPWSFRVLLDALLAFALAQSGDAAVELRLEEHGPDGKQYRLRISYLVPSTMGSGRQGSEELLLAYHNDSHQAANVSLTLATQRAKLLGVELRSVDRLPGETHRELLLCGQKIRSFGLGGPQARAAGNCKGLAFREWCACKGRQFAARMRASGRSERSLALAGIHLFTLPALLGYCLHGLMSGHEYFSVIYLLALGFMTTAAVLNLLRVNLRICVWATLAACYTAVGLAAIGDGLMRSESLWLLSLIPLMTVFVLGNRAFFVAFFLCLTHLVAMLALGQTELASDQHTTSFGFLVGVRLVSLQIHSAAALLLGFMTSNFAKEYAEQRIEMARALEKAQSAHREKSQFLTNMSHEIRTPLNGVLGLAECLVAQELPGPQKQAVRTIHRCGGHLLTLLDDVLDLSDAEGHSASIARIQVDLDDLLGDVSRLFQTKAKMQGVSLVVSGIPSGVSVMGDPTRLMQVLSNLVGNALKFCDEGKVELALCEVNRIEQGGVAGYDLVIEVRDEGIGILPSKLESLFDDYVQVHDELDRERGGTGLGLAISNRLVRAMGGKIEVESRYGEGSVFRVHLWLAAVGERLSQRSNSVLCSLESLDPVEDAENTQLILVVDDNAINRKVALAQLQRMSYSAQVATDGFEAVELAAQTKFDAILMDVRMPGMDGLQATRLIRAGQGASKDAPILALTADSYEEQKRLCFDAGMNGHLSKPFRAADLQAHLEDLWSAA